MLNIKKFVIFLALFALAQANSTENNQVHPADKQIDNNVIENAANYTEVTNNASPLTVRI